MDLSRRKRKKKNGRKGQASNQNPMAAMMGGMGMPPQGMGM